MTREHHGLLDTHVLKRADRTDGLTSGQCVLACPYRANDRVRAGRREGVHAHADASMPCGWAATHVERNTIDSQDKKMQDGTVDVVN